MQNKEWSTQARIADIADASIEDIQKLCKYLDVCVKYDAKLRVC